MNNNRFDLLNNSGDFEDGFQTVYSKKSRKRRRGKKEQRQTVNKTEPIAVEPPVTAVAKPVEAPKVSQEHNNAALRLEIIAVLVGEAKKGKQKDREADVVAVLSEFENEGVQLKSIEDGAFKRSLVQRIHAHEARREEERQMQAERAALTEASDVPEVKEEEEVIEEEAPEELSLSEYTRQQVRDLDFNSVDAEHTMRDWISKMTGSDAEEFRKELNNEVVPLLAEKILNSEITRIDNAEKSLRDYAGQKGLLVKFFNELLQPLEHDWSWFVDTLIEIASRLKETAIRKKVKEDLLRMTKNCVFFLSKQPKHREEKQTQSTFKPPSGRFFPSLSAETLNSLALTSRFKELDELARDYHSWQDQVSDESLRANGDDSPNQSQRIENFDKIHRQCIDGAKRAHAKIKGERSIQERIKEDILRIQEQFANAQSELMGRQNQCKQEKAALLLRKEQIERELDEIALKLENLSKIEIEVAQKLDQKHIRMQPDISKREEEMKASQVKIDQQEAERLCYASVENIAGKVLHRLQTQNSGVRSEQVQFRQKIEDAFVRSGRDYQNLLTSLKHEIDTHIDKIEPTLRELQPHERIYSSFQQRQLNEIRKGQQEKLRQLKNSSQLIQSEIYQTQMDIKQREQQPQGSFSDRTLGNRMNWMYETSLPPHARNLSSQVNDDSQDFMLRSSKPPFAGFLGMGLRQHSLSKPPQSKYMMKSQPTSLESSFNSRNGPREPDMQSPMQNENFINNIVDFDDKPTLETRDEQSLTTENVSVPVNDEPEAIVEEAVSQYESPAEQLGDEPENLEVQEVEPVVQPPQGRRGPMKASIPPAAKPAADPSKGGPWAAVALRARQKPSAARRIQRGDDKKMKKDPGRFAPSRGPRRGGRRPMYGGGRRDRRQ